MKICKNYVVITIVAILYSISVIRADAVCDLNTLKVELRQDLEDNGMLDCQRVIEPPHFKEETEEEKNKRLAAQWDTSCSFESQSDWKGILAKTYDITQLVDSVGDPVANDFEDQADMCEIVRAAVAKNLFNISDLNMKQHQLITYGNDNILFIVFRNYINAKLDIETFFLYI